MKVLVIGSGGREHAAVKKFKESSQVREIHCAPGNALIAKDCECHPSVNAGNQESILALAERLMPDLIFVGPEDPLVHGLADQLRQRKFLVFGPGAEGARLEASKNFCKEFLLEAGIPTAKYRKVSRVVEVEELIRQGWRAPFVLKADGLAAGKGVVICADEAELLREARRFFEERAFGDASSSAVLEEFLSGYELSLIVITDGKKYFSLPVAQDHKRLGEGGTGPNTGGMGTVAPMNVDVELDQELKTKVIAPALRGLQRRKMDYRGVLFFGLMITSEGPSVLEINVRFGDPETQSILPLIETDFFSLCVSAAKGDLIEVRLKKDIEVATVVLAAPGYPDNPEKGIPIRFQAEASSQNSYWLGAGISKSSEDIFVSSGGRVLNAVGIGATRQAALEKAYELIRSVQFPRAQYRKDIGRS